MTERLHLSKDRKVSPLGNFRGVYRGRDWGYLAKVANSFGLPAGLSCPGKTRFCDSCYAANLERYNGVGGAMMRNWRILQGKNIREIYVLLDEMLNRYWRQVERLNLPAKDRIFRIHWDGDFYSLEYAMAWAFAMMTHPKIKFWAYTRSFVGDVNVVPILSGIQNFELYLSTDEWNVAAANAVVQQFPDVHLALCAIDYQIARTLIDRPADKVAVVCPENSGKIGLNDGGRGACVDCALCVDGRRDVIFSTTHRENALPRQARLALIRN